VAVRVRLAQFAWGGTARLGRKSVLGRRGKGGRKMPRKKASGRKYSKGASAKVERAMHERKQGTLRSGGSGKKVTSRKQAIAIGLSEARREGRKVPPKS